MSAGTPNEEAQRRGIEIGSWILLSSPEATPRCVVRFDEDGDPVVYEEEFYRAEYAKRVETSAKPVQPPSAVEPSEDIREYCRMMAEYAPDVLSEDETFEDVFEYLLNMFRQHGRDVLARAAK